MVSSESKSINKELWELVADLHPQVAWRGLVRSALGLTGLWALTLFTVTAPDAVSFLLRGALTGFFYASVFVTTHDALHHTLTGMAFWDEVIPRLLSYPALWFHGTYKELHLIHHRTNGHDFTDPERPQFTLEEYRGASALKQWRIRHQWFFDLFVAGGFGFIGHHVAQGIQFSSQFPRLKRALWTDLIGIVALNGGIYATAIHFGYGGRYFLYFLLMERISGMVHQFRSRIEHYGLWGKEPTPIETQLYTARNVLTSAWGRFYMNGLNFHSMHHSFPRLPYYNLKEGDRRIHEWAVKRGRPLPDDHGYLATGWRLARHPTLIDLSSGEARIVPIPR